MTINNLPREKVDTEYIYIWVSWNPEASLQDFKKVRGKGSMARYDSRNTGEVLKKCFMWSTQRHTCTNNINIVIVTKYIVITNQRKVFTGQIIDPKTHTQYSNWLVYSFIGIIVFFHMFLLKTQKNYYCEWNVSKIMMES